MSTGKQVFMLLFAVILGLGGSYVIAKKQFPQTAQAAVKAPVGPIPAPPVPYGTPIAWQGTYESALEMSRQSNKPVMVVFYTDWCGWCRKMETNTFSSGSVVAESQYFINVRVNGDQRKDVLQRYGIDGFPDVVFTDSTGKVIHTAGGYWEPMPFSQHMQYARSRFAA